MDGPPDRRDRIAGVLLGTAVGDALGLPFEGMSRRRVARRLAAQDLRHRFLWGRGMCSDDTEHTIMVAQSWLAQPADPRAFARDLAWRLRWWFLRLPAGIGFGTLRALLKLWLGFRRGVRSAGNGPAMRSGIIGACLAADRAKLRAYVASSTRLTHTDPRAEQGALAVALACGYAVGQPPGAVDSGALLRLLRDHCDQPQILAAWQTLERHLEAGDSPADFARALGQGEGVSGYVLHTVPVALYCWLSFPDDFGAALEACVRLGGDTDTSGAIVGALAGAGLGARAIPERWLANLWEWPCSRGWLQHLADRLASEESGPLRLFWPGLLLRNLVFLVLVLLHGFGRLLPPYG